MSALVKESDGGTWPRLVRASVKGAQGEDGAVRPVPLHPEDFAAALARKAFTNGKSDCELVAGLYARTLDGAFGGAKVLTYNKAGWGNEEAKALAKVLPLARNVEFIDLSENPGIVADGWRALGEAIGAGAAPKLKLVYPCVGKNTQPQWH